MYHGDIKLGDTIDIKFTTRQISGAPSTLSSSPVISAYPGNSTTELTAGITLTVDFDARTGLNNVRVVATSGNGYATATNYTLVITTGTVNSVSVVGECIGSFSIENRRSDVQFWNGTQVATPATAGVPDVNAKNINNVATTSVTTINANQGTTQPVNFTGTGASALAKSDMVDIAGAAVSTSSAQIGVNLIQILGTTLTETAGQIAAAFKKFFDIATPTSTANRITLVDTATAVTNGVTVTTNNDKTGYTASTVSDKTGYSLTAAYDSAKTASQAGDAMALTSGERNSTADALLNRNVAGGSSTGRLVKEGLYVLRNKTDIQSGTLTVYQTDDVTAAYTAAVTTAAGNPITTIDPV